MDLSKIFTRVSKAGRSVPIVSVPDLDEETRQRIEAVREESARYLSTRRGYLRAMIANGKPIANRPVPARKRSKPTKHVRHMERVRARSSRAA